MKRLIAAFFITLAMCLPALAADVTFRTSDIIVKGPWVDVRAFSNLSTAVASASTTNKTIVIPPGTHTCNNLTIPATKHIKVLKGGYLAPNAGKTLTMAAPDAGRYKIFSGSGTVTINSGDHVYSEWKAGGVGGAAADNATGLQWAFDTQVPVDLASGTYSYTPPLTINKDSVIIRGKGRYRTILAPTATAANALHLASTASVSGIVLEDFKLQGNATCNNGLVLGTQTPQYYAIGLDINRLYITSFSKSGAAGLRIITSWWSNFRGINFEGSYNNIHIPAGAVTTTLTFSGNTTVRNAENVGFLAEGAAGTVNKVRFESISFEYNKAEAFKSTAAKANFEFEDCYFEQNAVNGPGIFTITGGSNAYEYTIIDMRNCRTDGPLAGYSMSLDYVYKSVIDSFGGLINGTITTTANCDVLFRNMNVQSAGDFLVTARALLGQIRAEEYIPAQGKWETYYSAGNRFEGHIATYQATAPTIAAGAAAGTGATVALATGATDTAGRIQLVTGSGSMSTGQYARVTFNKAYGRMPRVLLSMGSASTAATTRMYVTENTAYFDVNFAVAEGTGTALYINYLVIE